MVTSFISSRKVKVKEAGLIKENSQKLSIFSDASCVLPKSDPWDPSIINFINPNHDPMKNCIPSLNISTSLIDGQLFFFKEFPDAICKKRCLKPMGDDYKLSIEEWSEIVNGTRPECDVIEVECRRPGEPQPYYQFLHSQTFPPG